MLSRAHYGSASGVSRQDTGIYSPDLLPMMQGLLHTLADIDFEFRKDLETVRQSSVAEPLKQKSIATLERHHREKRAPYLKEINRLETQLQRMFA